MIYVIANLTVVLGMTALFATPIIYFFNISKLILIISIGIIFIFNLFWSERILSRYINSFIELCFFKNRCSICEAPTRKLWPPQNSKGKFELVDSGNYISLKRCPSCSALWCESPYEPYSSFIYLVRWEDSQEAWKAQHSIDDGNSLRNWHIKQIKELYPTLSPPDKKAVDAHRKRSYGRNPVDGM